MAPEADDDKEDEDQQRRWALSRGKHDDGLRSWTLWSGRTCGIIVHVREEEKTQGRRWGHKNKNEREVGIWRKDGGDRGKTEIGVRACGRRPCLNVAAHPTGASTDMASCNGCNRLL